MNTNARVSETLRCSVFGKSAIIERLSSVLVMVVELKSVADRLLNLDHGLHVLILQGRGAAHEPRRAFWIYGRIRAAW